jgi:DNA repair exonuclease SbcCD ATPase subunit
MILRTILILGSLLVLLSLPSQSFSVDVAPRITDREIVERLTRLEEGQKALAQRFDDTNRRIDDTNHRIEELQKALSQRIDDTNRRIDELKQDLTQRIDELRQILLWGIGIVFAGMFSLVGFVLWDRRSVLTPAVRQMDGLKEREEKLEAALKEYALKSPELAESLKKMGLL